MKNFLKNPEKRKQFFILFFTIVVGLTFILGIVVTPLSYNSSQPEQETCEEVLTRFTQQWIFDEGLTEFEKDCLFQRGITIATYSYLDQSDSPELDFLVQTINLQKPEGQVILEKIKSEETGLEINSLKNSVEVENLTQESIFKGLCETMYYPPADCASFVE
ncbi:MAG: hypothetical protein KAU95_02835 [Candidatus Aenigmarchaeota archaeon]|nr:hypothetical protein [Candidatus Aenigmarchaeota archaeon]